MSAYAIPHRRKSVRFTSSEPSKSNRSALPPTSIEQPSIEAGDLESASDSELSSSSEEPSDESSASEDENEDQDDEDDGADAEDHTEIENSAATPHTNPVVNLRANRGTKPIMRLRDDENLGPDIRIFLKEFLPQLKAANEELEMQRKAGTLRSLDAGSQEEGEPYIEMDLGLGVLEAKDIDAAKSEDSSSSGSEMEDEECDGEKDLLGKLLGRDKEREHVNIEVVQDNKTEE